MCTYRYDALQTTMNLLPLIAETLQRIVEDSSFSDCGAADTLLHNITSSKFIVTLTLACMIIGVTSELCLKLQGKVTSLI